MSHTNVQSAAATCPGLPSAPALPSADGTPTFAVDAAELPGVFAAIRAAGYETNTFVTAIDRFPNEPRFQVSWQFLSIANNARLRLQTDTSGSDPHVPTCTAHWPGASFSERECFDMFGVRFDGHPDLRRLLMPEAYPHFPLRKDFPHQGIEPDALYRQWDRERRSTWSEDER